MNTIDEITKFYNIIEKDGHREGVKYKNGFVPKELSKYISLSDKNHCEDKELNNKKLNLLKENKLWISSHRLMNDPFEFKFLSFDKGKLEELGWDYELLKKSIGEINDRHLISSFTSNEESNIPLWAHYSNNHHGYCVEYNVIQPNFFYRVYYEPKRIKSSVIPNNIFANITKRKDITKDNTSARIFMSYIMTFMCKYKAWEYENEIRLLYPTMKKNSGLAVPLNEIGLEVKSINIGYNCSKEYEKELIEISKSLNCSIYKMYYDEFSEDYNLKKRRI